MSSLLAFCSAEPGSTWKENHDPKGLQVIVPEDARCIDLKERFKARQTMGWRLLR
ncbi:MAG: hypothetical protein ACT6SF_17670 [Hydrogenophaga sp.]|uniref:hypothetical protein n=1 Tax=Hydrogenophaga sp. TaxID=1904254 RepID=UPI002A05D456|nr:hypothetical protein [Hydrogenophaga sp.]